MILINLKQMFDEIHNGPVCPPNVAKASCLQSVDWTSGLDYWTDRFSFKMHI